MKIFALVEQKSTVMFVDNPFGIESVDGRLLSF